MNAPLPQKGLIIVNKSGGLVYSGLASHDQNEMLVVGSTLHTLLEILEHIRESQPLNDPPSHSKTIEYGQSRIAAFKTLSGYSFIFLWDATDPPFRSVYLHFCETVVQDYNYRPGMLVRSERFRPEQYF